MGSNAVLRRREVQPYHAARRQTDAAQKRIYLALSINTASCQGKEARREDRKSLARCRTTVPGKNRWRISNLASAICHHISDAKRSRSAENAIPRYSYIRLPVCRKPSLYRARAVLLQGNCAMQRGFPTLADSFIFIVICFRFRKIKAFTGSHLLTKSRLNVKLKINK